MRLILNGKPREVEDGLTLTALAQLLELPRMIVVELNGKIIDRADFGDTQLQDADSLEVVVMVGGG